MNIHFILYRSLCATYIHFSGHNVGSRVEERDIAMLSCLLVALVTKCNYVGALTRMEHTTTCNHTTHTTLKHLQINIPHAHVCVCP